MRQVSATVEDWPAMRARAHELIAELRDPAPGVDRDTALETAELLAWMDDGHFTFLGFREYDLLRDGDEDRLRRVEDSGLGILGEARGPRAVSLTARASALARDHRPLIVTKANTRSTVHRPGYLDYVGVKRFDEQGEVVGERRFLGLYTRAGYRADVRDIPVSPPQGPKP
jgi:glutamate dehydrogenase